VTLGAGFLVFLGLVFVSHSIDKLADAVVRIWERMP